MGKETVLSVARIVSILIFPMFFVGSIGCSSVDNKEIDKCWDLKKTDLREAIEYGRSLLDKDRKNIEVYECLASAYHDAGHFEEAYNTIKKALKIEEDKWFEDPEPKFYEEVGGYAKEVDLDEAIEYYKKGLDRAMEDDHAIALPLKNDIGFAYYLKGDINNALKYLRGALYDFYNHDFKNDKGVDYRIIEIFIYSNLAIAHYKNGDKESAEEFLQKAITSEESHIDCIEYPGDYNVKIKVGYACEVLKSYDCAEKHYLDAAEMSKGQGDSHKEAFAYKNLARLYDDMGKKDLAKEYYKRAYKLFKLINADGFAEMMLEKIKEQEPSEKQSET
jgi:tetratricopeptide (TPR) repeat protein